MRKYLSKKHMDFILNMAGAKKIQVLQDTNLFLK